MVPPLCRCQFVASVIAGAHRHVDPGVHLARGGVVEDDEVGMAGGESRGVVVSHGADEVLFTRRVWALLTRVIGVQMNPDVLVDRRSPWGCYVCSHRRPPFITRRLAAARS